MACSCIVAIALAALSLFAEHQTRRLLLHLLVVSASFLVSLSSFLFSFYLHQAFSVVFCFSPFAFCIRLYAQRVSSGLSMSYYTSSYGIAMDIMITLFLVS